MNEFHPNSSQFWESWKIFKRKRFGNILTDNALWRKTINYCIFGCAWIKIICKQYDMEIPLPKNKTKTIMEKMNDKTISPLGFAIRGYLRWGFIILLIISGHRPWCSETADCKSTVTETLFQYRTKDNRNSPIKSNSYENILFINSMYGHVIFYDTDGAESV